MIVHHLPEELMLSYALGHCSEGEALLVATHLTLCPDCRGEVETMEAMGGALLSEMPQDPLPDGLLEATLRRLEQEPRPSEPAESATREPLAGDAVLPRPILEYTGALDRIAWRSRMFGVLRYIELPIATDGVPVNLKRIRRGVNIPRHLHRAQELELYIAGGALDTGNGKRYARGDVSIYQRGEPHELRVDPDEDCILLCVHSAPLVPASFLGHIVYRLFRSP